MLILAAKCERYCVCARCLAERISLTGRFGEAGGLALRAKIKHWTFEILNS